MLILHLSDTTQTVPSFNRSPRFLLPSIQLPAHSKPTEQLPSNSPGVDCRARILRELPLSFDRALSLCLKLHGPGILFLVLLGPCTYTVLLTGWPVGPFELTMLVLAVFVVRLILGARLRLAFVALKNELTLAKVVLVGGESTPNPAAAQNEFNEARAEFLLESWAARERLRVLSPPSRLIQIGGGVLNVACGVAFIRFFAETNSPHALLFLALEILLIDEMVRAPLRAKTWHNEILPEITGLWQLAHLTRIGWNPPAHALERYSRD